MLTNTKHTQINYQEKFSHILVGLLQYSINNYIIYWKFALRALVKC
jgi:hypothetical protein